MAEQENTDTKKEYNDDLSDRKYVYDTYFHEANRISHRTDWFLIFHAILLEAFFAYIQKNNEIDFVLASIVCMGVATSYIWFMNGVRSRKSQAQFGKYMEDKDIMGVELSNMHKKIFRERKDKFSWIIYWAKDVPSFAVMIPLLWLITWEGLLLYYFKHYVCYAIIFSFVGIVIITIIISAVNTGIEPPKDSKNEST